MDIKSQKKLTSRGLVLLQVVGKKIMIRSNTHSNWRVHSSYVSVESATRHCDYLVDTISHYVKL